MNEACSCALAFGDAAQADTHQKPRSDRNEERIIPARQELLYRIN